MSGYVNVDVPIELLFTDLVTEERKRIFPTTPIPGTNIINFPLICRSCVLIRTRACTDIS